MVDQVKKAAYYHTKILDWPKEDRPREKLFKHGSHTLTEAELLGILLGSGTGGVTAVDVAKRLIVEHQSLADLATKGAAELSRMKGIGQAKAARILSAFEIARRIQANSVANKNTITTPVDLVKIFRPQLRDLKHEEFKVILFSSTNRIIRDVTITKGTLNASMVHPREVFKTAIDHLAASIVIMHNHPSGDPTPSKEDCQVTKQIVSAGETMAIPVLDHIILAGDNYYSFAESGMLG